MIKKLNYNQIDFDKYDLCLEKACQNADYARRDFLNIVVEGSWELLIFGDYEAVLPVPLMKKLGVKYVTMPKFCQQLGVFSVKDDIDLNEAFYQFLNRNYFVLFYSFNIHNTFKTNFVQRKTYQIQQKDYQEVKKDYSVHRRRNVRIVGNLVDKLEFDDQLSGDEATFLYNNAKGINNIDQMKIYFDLVKKLLDNKQGQLLVLRIDKEIQSLVFLYQTRDFSYLSLFVNKQDLYNPNIPSVVVDKCLQQFVGDKSFDFMGSMVDNVAKFNERFGAVAHYYSAFSHDKSRLFKNLLRAL